MEESTLCFNGEISKKKFDKLTNLGYTVDKWKNKSFISIKGKGVPLKDIPKIEKLLQRKVFLADGSKVKLCKSCGEPCTVEGFEQARLAKDLAKRVTDLFFGSTKPDTPIGSVQLTEKLREAISGAVEVKKPGADLNNIKISELRNLLGPRIQELFLSQDFGKESAVNVFTPYFLTL